MLIDIYARSMVTATRQDCVQLRDLPAPKPRPQAKGWFARSRHWLAQYTVLSPQRTRCIDPLKL